MIHRGATTLSGILVIDKPSQMTSHDVVSVIRRLTGEKRVGHAGTLDPMATGVLVVLIGPATRLAPYLTAQRKTYRARIAFGSRTGTDDAEGDVVETADVPRAALDPDIAASIVTSLVGVSTQVPPAYSALKQDGVTAHRAARAGTPLDLEPRVIEVFETSLLEVDPGPPPTWTIHLAVSKGSYVRAIARDLGPQLGTVAHLASLRRVASGDISEEQAHSLDALESGLEDVEAAFIPARLALGLPLLEVDDSTAARVADGRTLSLSTPGLKDPSDGPVALTNGTRLIAVYRRRETEMVPEVVIPGGVT